MNFITDAPYPALYPAWYLYFRHLDWVIHQIFASDEGISRAIFTNATYLPICSRTNDPAETPPPVVKRESLGHQDSSLSISRRDWPSYQANATSTSSPLDEGYLYSQTAQPMMGQTPNTLRYNQVGQANSATATAPSSMRSVGPHNSESLFFLFQAQGRYIALQEDM